MATDGVKIIEGDLAYDLYAHFMDMYNEGADLKSLQEQFENDKKSCSFDKFDYEICITVYALAFGEIGKLTNEMLEEVKAVIAEKATVDYWTKEFDKEAGEERQEELDKLLEKISKPNPKPTKREKKQTVLFDEADIPKSEDAESLYLKVLESDYDNYDARKKLVELYLKQKKYGDVIKHCEFVLSYKKFDFSTRKKLIESTAWEVFVIRLFMAYIQTGRYNDAIGSILKYKELETQAGVLDKYGLRDFDVMLYKLYFLNANVEGITEYKDLLLKHYEISESQLNAIEKQATQKII